MWEYKTERRRAARTSTCACVAEKKTLDKMVRSALVWNANPALLRFPPTASSGGGILCVCLALWFYNPAVMEKIPELAILLLAVLGFVAWLGGGRKWAFRTLLATLILAVVGVIGAFLYIYFSEKAASHRAQEIHQCAIAKVVNARCIDVPDAQIEGSSTKGVIECPSYFLDDSATKEQEESAVSAAEKECAAEVDPTQQSLHQEMVRYREEHNVKQEASLGKGWTVVKLRLNDKKCAEKIRTAYPKAYNDLSDSTLTKKTLAKYPTYCDVE